MKRTNKGFTLVELIIVIAVIGVLAAILIPVFSNVVNKANQKSAMSDARNMVSRMTADLTQGNGGLPMEDTIICVKKGGKIFAFGYDAEEGALIEYEGQSFTFSGANTADGMESFVTATVLPALTADSFAVVSTIVNANDELQRVATLISADNPTYRSIIHQLGFNENEVTFVWGYDVQQAFGNDTAEPTEGFTINGVPSTQATFFADAKAALAGSGNVVIRMYEDYTQTTMETLEVAAGVNATFYLNGNTYDFSFTDYGFSNVFKVRGTLTLKGAGTIDCFEPDWGVGALADVRGGTLIFDGPTALNSDDSLVSVTTGGRLVMKSGKLETKAEYATGVKATVTVLNGTLDMQGGEIVMTNTAAQSRAIHMRYQSSAADPSDPHVTISGGTIKNEKGYGITMFDGDVTMTGGRIETKLFGICNNGSETYPATSMTVSGGEIVSQTTGIFHPGINGTLTVSGAAYIEGGNTGIEMRAGTLTMTGGTVIGKNATLACTTNSSGSTTRGAGIAIAQHTTKKDINVTISGGVVKGKVGLYQKDIQNNGATYVAKIHITAYNCEIYAINGGTDAIQLLSTGSLGTEDIHDVTTGTLAENYTAGTSSNSTQPSAS